MKCPKCQRRLREEAEACMCGWTKDGGQSRHIDCAHAPHCTRPAIVREQTPTGWALFCEHHYVEYHHKKSVERCKQLGLHTVEQMKEFCRKKVKTAFKRMDDTVEREPGQDEEERRAA